MTVIHPWKLNYWDVNNKIKYFWICNVTCLQPSVLKEQFIQKWKYYHNSLTLMSSKPTMKINDNNQNYLAVDIL